ncbi:hypothetical protein E6O75_ATG11637 [Venturia nashicola]|uniref:Uncharacterized protein n=1 Tax=Venturia nashicola TaxID=86259 RepID=A0A4Z1NYD4_9PEZI|nr:hypothetical protein E6O75_ATG11637 [Venturia nashicola]
MASPNIWAQMGYVPPRGACNHKESLLSSKCACLRFMIHPMKATTSFDCDGCAHHASFHTMENPLETEIIKRWAASEQDNTNTSTTSSTTVAGGSRKRPRRAIENGNGKPLLEELARLPATAPRKTATATTTKRGKKDTRTTNRVEEIVELEEDEEDAIEEVGSGIVGGFFTRR